MITSRLVINPLREYPGPLLARLTNEYAGWHAIEGDIHLMTYLDHLKYGKNTVVCGSNVYPPDLEQDLLSGKLRIDWS